MTDYRMPERPRGTPMMLGRAHPGPARDPWSDYALRVVRDSRHRPGSPLSRVRVFRAMPVQYDELNGGGEWVTFDPHFAFSHADGVSTAQHRRMHVVTALVPAVQIRGMHGWFGRLPVRGRVVDTPPRIGDPCTPGEVWPGDWMALPSVGAAPDAPQFWRRCVARDEESLWWQAPAGRFAVSLTHGRVSHRLVADSTACGDYFE